MPCNDENDTPEEPPDEVSPDAWARLEDLKLRSVSLVEEEKAMPGCTIRVRDTFNNVLRQRDEALALLKEFVQDEVQHHENNPCTDEYLSCRAIMLLREYGEFQ